MLLHANAVAEDGSLGERAGRIDGDDADGLALLPVLGGERSGQRAFAGTGSTGYADGVRLAGVGKQSADVVAPLGRPVFHAADDACERAPVPGKEPLNEVIHV